jgi:hypothetical protein
VRPCDGWHPGRSAPCHKAAQVPKWRNGGGGKNEVVGKLRKYRITAPELQVEETRGGSRVHLLRKHPEDPVRLTPKGKRKGRC